MKNYFNDQNTAGYTPEQLEKMNQEIKEMITKNNWDEYFNQQEIKTAEEKILQEMDNVIEKESMNNYTVSIYVSETQTDTFTIQAPDLETAQRDAMTEAVNRDYNIDDVIDVVEEKINPEKPIKAIMGVAADYGLCGKNSTCACIVFGTFKEGLIIDDPEVFFKKEAIQKLREKGGRLFLFDFDQGYRECLERYPQLYQ